MSRWAFSAAALDLLAECVAEAAAAREAGGAPEAEKGAPLLEATEDRHGGVEAEVRPGAPWQVSGLSRSCTAGARPRHVHDTASDGSWQVSGFVEELHSALQAWEGAGKRGVWLRLPAEAHAYVDAAVAAGFEYHHATAGYLQLTRWLPPTPSPLPRYAFTSVGVGGVVVNGKREVLMVQERVSPSKRMQGCTDAQPAGRRGGAEEPSPQPSRRLCAGRGSCRAASPSQGRTLRRPWRARLPRRRACGRSSTASSACATRTAAASGSPTCTLSCVDCGVAPPGAGGGRASDGAGESRCGCEHTPAGTGSRSAKASCRTRAGWASTRSTRARRAMRTRARAALWAGGPRRSSLTPLVPFGCRQAPRRQGEHRKLPDDPQRA